MAPLFSLSSVAVSVAFAVAVAVAGAVAFAVAVAGVCYFFHFLTIFGHQKCYRYVGRIIPAVC